MTDTSFTSVFGDSLLGNPFSSEILKYHQQNLPFFEAAPFTDPTQTWQAGYAEYLTRGILLLPDLCGFYAKSTGSHIAKASVASIFYFQHVAQLEAFQKTGFQSKPWEPRLTLAQDKTSQWLSQVEYAALQELRGIDISDLLATEEETSRRHLEQAILRLTSFIQALNMLIISVNVNTDRKLYVR